MTIAVGDRLPTVTFKSMIDGAPAALTTDDVFKGKTIALFAVPGAFTPGCSKTHLPGYLANHDAILAKGVDGIVCVAVNDAFVMDAWSKANDADGKILDRSAGGLGLRSQRYSMIVKDGVVADLTLEEKPGTIDLTGAACMIGKL